MRSRGATRPRTCQWSVVAPAVDRAGFTLVEIVFVSLLSVIVAGGMLTALMSGRSFYLSSDGSLQVQQETRRAFDSVMRELRESANISCGTAMPLTAAAPCATNAAQLNFQTAQVYSAASGMTWGSDATCVAGGDPFLHYAFVASGTNTQLVRYCDTAANGTWIGACVAPMCRVLANHVNPQTSGFLAVDTTGGTKPNIVTLNLEIRYTNPSLPSGTLSSGVLTSQVRLRNSY